MSKNLVYRDNDAKLSMYSDYTYRYDFWDDDRDPEDYSEWGIQGENVYVVCNDSGKRATSDADNISAAFIKAAKEADDIIRLDEAVEEFLSE